MKQDIKQKIIQDTIRLIEGKDSRLMDITVRDICHEAGISVSQINYHFQTKENLIAQCVQVIIGDVIARSEAVALTIQAASAVEKLMCMLKRTFGFLYNNENISKISILTDHQKPHANDNTAQTIKAYQPLVEDALKERSLPYDAGMITASVILDFQGVFLRTDVIRQDLHVELREESTRNQWVDEYVERAFR
jgi:AcrR family transcriptional regulator